MTAGKGQVQQMQAAELLHALRQHGIDSKAALAEAWRKNPLFLQRQLKDCLRKSKQQLLLGVWSQALSQAFHDQPTQASGV